VSGGAALAGHDHYPARDPVAAAKQDIQTKIRSVRMAKLNLKPMSRLEKPGSKATFMVRLDDTQGMEGGQANTFSVRASYDAPGYEAHFANGDTTAPAGGVQVLEVDVPQGASMAARDFYIEAHDSSGNVLAKDHVEVLATAGWMLWACLGAVLVGILALFGAAAWNAGVITILLVALGGLVALLGIVGFVMYMWGRGRGFSWHFTQ